MGKKKNSRKVLAKAEAKKNEKKQMEKRKKKKDEGTHGGMSSDDDGMDGRFRAKRRSKKRRLTGDSFEPAAEEDGGEPEGAAKRVKNPIVSLPPPNYPSADVKDPSEAWGEAGTPEETARWVCAWRGAASIDSTEATDALKALRKGFGLRVRGSCPPPLAGEAINIDPDADAADDCALPPLFRSVFRRSKGVLTVPTPVQRQAWPALLSGRGAVLMAPTGSGKTLAYGIPLVQAAAAAVVRRPKGASSPAGLVLVPTRELASQAAAAIRAACRAAFLLEGDAHTNFPAEGEDEKERRKKIRGGFYLKKMPKLRIMAIYGGSDKIEQIRSLDEDGPPHIVVATPGRLLDLLASRTLSLRGVIALVLDECDQLLKLGFEEQVSAICAQIRPDRQTCLVSATLPKRLGECAEQWVPEPRVEIRASVTACGGGPAATTRNHAGSGDDGAAAPPTEGADSKNLPRPSRATELAAVPSRVAQILRVCTAHERPKWLLEILSELRAAEAERNELSDRRRAASLVLIFFSRIESLKAVGAFLDKNGVSCAELHGKLDQRIRERTLADFKAGKVSTLLATDVAGRGVHVNRIECVVNYDFPDSLEQYVHRCGRAGRNCAPGSETGPPVARVFSFFTRNFAPMAADTLALLRRSGSWVDPELLKLTEEGSGEDTVQGDRAA